VLSRLGGFLSSFGRGLLDRLRLRLSRFGGLLCAGLDGLLLVRHG